MLEAVVCESLVWRIRQAGYCMGRLFLIVL